MKQQKCVPLSTSDKAAALVGMVLGTAIWTAIVYGLFQLFDASLPRSWFYIALVYFLGLHAGHRMRCA